MMGMLRRVPLQTRRTRRLLSFRSLAPSGISAHRFSSPNKCMMTVPRQSAESFVPPPSTLSASTSLSTSLIPAYGFGVRPCATSISAGDIALHGFRHRHFQQGITLDIPKLGPVFRFLSGRANRLVLIHPGLPPFNVRNQTEPIWLSMREDHMPTKPHPSSSGDNVLVLPTVICGSRLIGSPLLTDNGSRKDS